MIEDLAVSAGITVAQARLVLEALKEPTIEMILAGAKVWGGKSSLDDANDSYRAMIDRALREPANEG